MKKLYAILFFLSIGLGLAAQGEEKYSRYAISESDLELPSNSEGDVVLDISTVKVDRYLDIAHAEPNYITIPMMGTVRLDIDGSVSHLLVSDQLMKYGAAEVKLSKPVSLKKPNNVSTRYVLYLSPSELNTSALDQLPIRPDSIRVVVRIDVKDDEATGAVIKTKTSTERSVVKFRRIMSIERNVEVKIEPFDWESVNDIAPMIDWDESYAIIQDLFIDQSSRIPVAILQKNNDSSTLAFLDRSDPSNKPVSVGAPTIKAVPNPAINDLRFEIENLPSGNYTLKIKNILGELKMKKSFFLETSEIIPVDINHLRKGSYFYILENEEGSILSTKRLIVLRP